MLVLAATNRRDLIDSAILRPGRFDFILEFPLPDEKARREIFKVHTRGKPLADDVDLQSLAQGTENRSGADIDAICHEASMMAIADYINAGPKNNKLQILRKHFDAAIKSLRSRGGQ